jgi:hypothetical protein
MLLMYGQCYHVLRMQLRRPESIVFLNKLRTLITAAASAIIFLTFKDGFMPKRSRPVGPGVPENHRERARKTSVI